MESKGLQKHLRCQRIGHWKKLHVSLACIGPGVDRARWGGMDAAGWERERGGARGERGTPLLSFFYSSSILSPVGWFAIDWRDSSSNTPSPGLRLKAGSQQVIKRIHVHVYRTCVYADRHKHTHSDIFDLCNRWTKMWMNATRISFHFTIIYGNFEYARHEFLIIGAHEDDDTLMSQ